MIDFNNKTLFKLSKTDESAAHDVLPLLVQGEQIIGVYKALRDYVVFTTKRIIAVNVQGVTGKKKDFSTLPYAKIQAFSIETAGTLDLDSELELWFSGLGCVRFDFTGSSDIVRIGQLIGNAIL
ncbi:MAG: PH domain-containing protein [Lachnospiraceae bacterium]|nr:PH domain-containing protein [Lachnospiraceae bacterium]MBQ7776968.1 PH domain-containing protein [Lachnospiraceae bacterium]